MTDRQDKYCSSSLWCSQLSVCVYAVLDALGLLYTPTQPYNLLICWGPESQPASVKVLDRREATHLMCQHTGCLLHTQWQHISITPTFRGRSHFKSGSLCHLNGQNTDHHAWKHTHWCIALFINTSPLLEHASHPPHHLSGLIPSSPSHMAVLAEGRRTSGGLRDDNDADTPITANGLCYTSQANTRTQHTQTQAWTGVLPNNANWLERVRIMLTVMKTDALVHPQMFCGGYK